MFNAAKYIREIITKTQELPGIGLILGSGLGKIADEIDGVKIPYEQIPGFKTSTIQGHAGNLVIGKLCDKNVIAMQGRLHYYEGHSIQDIIFPVRVMKLLGVKNLIVTNAAGGINQAFTPGDLMIIQDHINFTGNNPLIGKNIDELGVRFPDMSEAYSKELIKLAENTANNLQIKVQKGVYIAVTGPCYETPAEIRMFRTMGADAVGMSTVPEVITARHAGINVLGISCIANMACGILDQPLCHEEVIEITTKAEQNFSKLIKEILRAI